MDGFYNYESGDKVMCYIDDSKTNERFNKRRGYYITPGIFVEYNYGNGIVEINGKKNRITDLLRSTNVVSILRLKGVHIKNIN